MMFDMKDFDAEWTHFMEKVNHGASFYDARAIKFMNELPGVLKKEREHTAKLVKVACALTSCLCEMDDPRHCVEHVQLLDDALSSLKDGA